MSDQKAEQTSVEPGSLSAEPAVPHSSEVKSGPAAVLAPEPVQAASVDSPKLVPEQDEVSKADAAAKAAAPKVEAPNVEAPKVEAPKADAPRVPGRIMIMSSGDRAWGGVHGAAAAPEAEVHSGMFGKRRVTALAAVVVLAAAAGALGGALATAGFVHPGHDNSQTVANRALEAQVAQLNADLAAVKTSVDHTSKLGMVQFNKTSERLDKVEKAQIEPAVRLARLSETVEKLRVAPVAPAVVAAVPPAAKEVTGSISPQATAPAPKPEVTRLPTLEGWVLRDVADGGALIEGRRHGVYEVYAGDAVPGLGRVDAIRRQDGRWVVVTSKGLIVAH